MKQLLLKKLFCGQPARQYLTLSIGDDNVKEKVFFQSGTGPWIEVTRRQFVLGQIPFIIGIWCIENNNDSPKAKLKITDAASRDLVLITLEKLKIIELVEGNVLLYKLVSTKFYFIQWLQQKLLLCYFFLQRTSEVTFYELNAFCAAYLYPRKVTLACFGKQEYYNLFPVDLQGFITESGIYLLGLRNTNVTLIKILEEKKIVVCDVSSNKKEELFGLGKHHSSKPPALDALPFSFLKSELFQVSIPDIAGGYQELEIIKHSSIGSHTILIGKVLNQKMSPPGLTSTYHLHIAYALKLPVTYETV